jgi:hypothetical protein
MGLGSEAEKADVDEHATVRFDELLWLHSLAAVLSAASAGHVLRIPSRRVGYSYWELRIGRSKNRLSLFQ